MTPLAHRIVKELTLPKAKRTEDVGGVREQMSGVHCFEVSEIVSAAEDMAANMLRTGMDADLMFLPAPKTWIEFKYPIVEEGRIYEFTIGYLIEAKSGFAGASECVLHNGQWYSGRKYVFELSGIQHLRGREYREQVLSDATSEYWDGIAKGRFFRAILAFINTPRVIGQRQHMPHRGLEKRLTEALGPQGKFPLHAWTEILLHVTPPKDMSAEPSTEAHLTGERALHFCRAHLRVRLGRLEIVKAHWRGDPSLGIKQSRYQLVA